jgi:hypothetical protein
VQAVGLDPDGGGLALARRAAPLARAALRVRSREPPLAVLARRLLVIAALDGDGVAKRDDRTAVAFLATVLDRANVLACVHRGRLGAEAASAGPVDQRQRVERLAKRGRVIAESGRQDTLAQTVRDNSDVVRDGRAGLDRRRARSRTDAGVPSGSWQARARDENQACRLTPGALLLSMAKRQRVDPTPPVDQAGGAAGTAEIAWPGVLQRTCVL